MAEQVTFELVSPEALVVSQSVAMVVVPGGDGDFGVLPRHAPLISTVRPGVITTYEGEGTARQPKERIFIAGGFAEVTGERCTVLAEQAVRVSDIDPAKVEQDLKAAREDLADAKDDAAKKAASAKIAVLEAMLKARAS